MKKVTYLIMRVFVLTMVIFFSLAVYRSTMQPDYHWALLVIDGTGKGGDYINILILFIWAWSTFLLLNWFKRKWYYLLPILLAGVCFYYTLKTYITGNDDMTFNGDALNIHINMGFVMVLVCFIALVATLYWSYLDNKEFKKLGLELSSKRLSVLIIIGITLTPLILYSFSHGDGKNHITSDKIAVILTILQGLLFFYITELSKKKKTIIDS